MTWHLLINVGGSWQDVDTCTAPNRSAASGRFEDHHARLFRYPSRVLSEAECKRHEPSEFAHPVCRTVPHAVRFPARLGSPAKIFALIAQCGRTAAVFLGSSDGAELRWLGGLLDG
jgi:hypothetical protein